MKLRSIHWSSLAVGFFALLLSAVGFFAEIFQAPPIPEELAQLIKNPLPMEHYQKLRRMSFSNKMGQFLFENTDPDGDPQGPWLMTSPTAIKARKDFFLKTLKVLSDIEIRHTHGLDTINLQSFSIDRPLYTLTLEPVKGTPLEISFGLINPIDNSTYFTVKGHEWIYQSNTLPIAFESVTPDELVDSKPLALNFALLKQIEVMSAPFEAPAVKLTRVESEWLDPRGKRLDRKKVDQFLRDLQDLRSYMVLDKLTEEQQQEVGRAMASPAYRLRFSLGSSAETFYATRPLEKIADLKLDKKQSFLFYREGTQYPLVLSGDQLGVLTRREQDLR